MTCPVCETENTDDASECAECGKALYGDADAADEIPLIEGHEMTNLAASDLDTAFALAAIDSDGVAPIDGLEMTLLADPKAEVEVAPLPELEDLTPMKESTVSSWDDGVLELDLGRERDLAPKTIAPDVNGPCPWCGFPGEGAVCNNCGRRRARYTYEAANDDGSATLPSQTILCPACFARVLVDMKCAECFAPLPRPDLV